MDSFRFRPEVTDLEDRLVPATPVELLALSQQIESDQVAVRHFLENQGKPRSVWTLTRIAEDFAFRAQRSEAAGQEFLNAFTVIQHYLAENPSAFPTFAGPSQWVLQHAAQGALNDQAATAVNATAIGLLERMGATVPAAARIPAPPAPPAPPPPPSETGQLLSETIPSLDATEWQNIGTQGLRSWDVVPGTGAEVKAGDTITAHYVGWLTDGTVFDSSVERGQPLTSALSGLIQGWQQGIPGMRVGGIRRLDIPAELAYGAAGSPPSIPANARLVFEFQMVSTTSTPASSTPAPSATNSSNALSQQQIQDLLNQRQS